MTGVQTCALPISLLDLSNITVSKSIFHTRVKEGLLFERELKCEKAQTSFAVALGLSNVFTDKNVFDGRILVCNERLNAQQEKVGSFFNVLHKFQQNIASMNIFHWIVVVTIFFLIFLLILWVVSRKRRKKDKVYTNDKPIRDETIKAARRSQWSEKISVGDKGVESEITPSQMEGAHDGIKKTEIETKQKIDVDQKDILQEEKKGDDFHVVAAKFPRKTSLPRDIEGIPKKTNDTFGTLSDEDKKSLAKMWPNKYDENGKQRKEKVEYLALSSYVKHTRKIGFKDDEIKKELLKAGWNKEDVNNALNVSI